MKLGIIGTGMIVKELLPELAKIDEIECCAICGTPRSKEIVDSLCSQFHISKGVTNSMELLDSDIDTVYVAVPNNLHYQICLDVLNADKNVIVEKPITSTYKEAVELANLARSKNLFFYEAITTQYLNNYAKIRELLPQIGEVKVVQCNYSQYSSRYDAFRAGQILPVFDPDKSGGALMDLNLYNIHYVMGLFGVPEQVNYHANIERNIDTSGLLFLQYPGFKAVCIAAKDCGAPARNVIQGTKGYILQNTPAGICGAVTLHLNDGTEQIFDENGDKHRMVAEFTAFAQQINAGAITTCYQMLELSLAISKVLTEARHSAGIHFIADDV